jgi:hypothetical protein
VLIVVGKIKDMRHSPVEVGSSDGFISPFMLMYAVLAGGGCLIDLIFSKSL